MTIKYRAIHERNTWRCVDNHKSKEAAIGGRDGGRNLLLRKGRVGKKWTDYGPVRCVFVWEEGAGQGTALRLKPGSTTEIQTASVPAHKLEEWDRKGGCPDRDMDACFR